MRSLVLEPAKLDNLFDGFEENGSGLLSDLERLNWLRLLRSEKVGVITFYELLRLYGTATNALEALPKINKTNPNYKINICSLSKAKSELRHAEKIGAKLIAFGEPSYPKQLSLTDVPPPLIYVKGQLSLLDRPILSIVGARNGSAAGQKITEVLAYELGKLGYVIASGLAKGIDTAAHKVSLENGTIAVVAGGIDVLYPPENSDLQNQISKKGLIISENPPGFRPRGQDFPRRNRIISGIAHAVLIIEAALKSGSLITARYALEQNREVFAVPGNPLDPRAAGTNKLIKQGANILTCTTDVTEILAPIIRQEASLFATRKSTLKLDKVVEPAQIMDEDRQKVMLALGPTPINIDELIRCTGLPPGKVQVILLELDLTGKIERHGRQLVSLCSSSDFGRLL